MNKPPVKLGLAFAVLVVYTIIWFGTLNYRHLIPSDEGRYAEMAREMLASGDWITPRYHDYLYFEKPLYIFGQPLSSFRFLVLGNGKPAYGLACWVISRFCWSALQLGACIARVQDYWQQWPWVLPRCGWWVDTLIHSIPVYRPA